MGRAPNLLCPDRHVDARRAHTQIRWRALAIFGPALVAAALCVVSPLRELSADTIPGRFGGAVLRCAGDFDLDHVDWIHRAASIPYYLMVDRRGELTSVFGPGPAVISALALADFGPGDEIDEESLHRRERAAAAVLVALAVAGLVVAALARVSSLRAALVGGVAALSFAGCASLGQGLWQATVAIVPLSWAIATMAWRPRARHVALATPALLALAVMVRPTIGALTLALGLAWAWQTNRAWRTWLVAGAIAVAAIAPLAWWNIVHLGTPLSLGQWHANTRLTERVMSFAPRSLAHHIKGLLVSPGRGLLWFAPIAVVGALRAAYSPDRATRLGALGIALQIVAMGTFFRWHGGLAYGPRLLAEATWVGVWLALAATESPRWLLAITATATVVVGQLGLWRFQPGQWAARPSYSDWAIAATLSDVHDDVPRTRPSPHVDRYACERDGTLRWVGSR